MLNPRFTPKEFAGLCNIKHGYKKIYDKEGRLLCGVSKKHVCDLVGNPIGTFKYKNRIVDERGKKATQVVYDSTFGVFRLVKNTLFLDNVRIGTINRKDAKSIFILVVTGAVLAAIIGLVAVTDAPDKVVPSILIEEHEGTINHNKEIGIFDANVHPGSSGDFIFDIINEHHAPLIYTLSVEQHLNGEVVDTFPIKYRLKMNNVYVSFADEWISSDKLKFIDLTIPHKSRQTFTLEWFWPFESGNDISDTLLGTSDATYQIIAKVTAEFGGN